MLGCSRSASGPDDHDSGGSNDAGHDGSGSSDASHDAGGSSDAGHDAGGGDASSPSPPSAQSLLNRVAACAGSPSIKSGFGLDGAGSISMYACGSAVYWTADLDVDCDGIQTPPCDTDPQGQPQTSIVDLAPTGDVDPTLLPYFVIPLGSPETAWYTSYGIELGQVGAVIYNGQVRYGIFADEAGGWFIGEASYAMCQLFLGPKVGNNDPCDPINGGIDPAQITYVTFTGAANRATGSAIYDHAQHVTLGVDAANAWLVEP
jgi:hypothetical protein